MQITAVKLEAEQMNADMNKYLEKAEVLIEALPYEKLDILLGKPEVFKIIRKLSETCHNGKAAVIRDRPEIKVEIAYLLPRSVQKVTICHGKLIEICKH